jgi:flagellar basal-body rod protein FlgG
MLEGLRTAAAGMVAMQQKLDGVANDLANANTTGYKHVRIGFKDLLYEQTGRPGANGVERGTGSAAVQAGRSFEQGAFKSTGQPLDVAIAGEGFLKVKLPDGRQALTRDGDLQIDGQGRLETATGALIQPAITVPKGVAEDQISIGRDGTVLAAGKQIGKLQLVSVRSTAGLLPTGDANAFVTTAASGPARPAPATSTLQQGVLEASNTDMAQAMVDMIDAQRTYQLTSKAIQTADTMMEIANGVKR